MSTTNAVWSLLRWGHMRFLMLYKLLTIGALLYVSVGDIPGLLQNISKQSQSGIDCIYNFVRNITHFCVTVRSEFIEYWITIKEKDNFIITAVELTLLWKHQTHAVWPQKASKYCERTLNTISFARNKINEHVRMDVNACAGYYEISARNLNWRDLWIVILRREWTTSPKFLKA